MPRLRNLFRNLFGRETVERDLDDELRATEELLIDEKVRAGLTPAAARRAARAELGSLESIKDSVRDVRAGAFVETVLQDLRFGARLLRRNPLFASTAALSLAIGIGATTTIFTVADALLFRAPAGVGDADRLVDVGLRSDGFRIGTVSYPNYLDLRRRASTLSGVYAYSVIPAPMSLAGANGAERIYGDTVTGNFFEVLGVRAAAGRLFDETDGASVVVFSHRFWTRRFQGDPSVVGRTVRLNGASRVLLGVAQEGFQGTTIRAPDVWVPIHERTLPGFEDRVGASLLMGARLKPHVSIGEATAELDTISRSLEREHPEENRNKRLRAAPLSPTPDLRGPLAAFLALLMGMVSIVLAVACTNLTGILLTRASVRKREIALRLAIGAGPARLARQLLVETMLLFVLGGAAGLLLARWMTSALVLLLPALPVPIDVSLALNGRALGFAAGLSFVTALLSGLVPALQASKVDLVSAMREQTPRGFGRLRLRSTFVVAQVALSLVLVVVGGLFVRTLNRVASMDPGFDPRNVEVAELDLSLAGYTGTTGPIFASELVQRLRGLPGVTAATLASVPPGSFEGLGIGIGTDGAAPADGQSSFDAAGNVVEPGYFGTLKIPLLAGRDFTAADRAGSPPVVIVSETTARRLWPARQAVGEYLQMFGFPSPESPQRLLVVGVARDVTYNSLVDGARELFVYLPFQQRFLSRTTIVARALPGRSLRNEIAALVASMNSNLPIVSAGLLEDRIEIGWTPQRVAASLSGSLGLVGLLLSAIGVYGITAYAVATRTREIGIRLALGARRSDVVGIVVRNGMSLVAIGALIGVTAAAAASQLLRSLLFGIPSIDPVSFGGAIVLFGLTGLAACYVPIRRAMQIDVTQALRYE
jgi:putative ABC transport system permease protein